MKLTETITIRKFLGEGYWGRVYEAHDQALGVVAVKVLVRQLAESDAEWAQRKADLIQEGNLLAQIDHRNVVRVHHVAIIDEAHASACHAQFGGSSAPPVCAAGSQIPILVLRYCNGGSADFFYRRGPQSVIDVQRIGLDISIGLVEIHGKGMLHRDIKPGNILFNDHLALIADFGLVTNDMQVGYASAQGYTDHLAPELFPTPGKDGLSSVKTDVWAFGMTIYRLLHGAMWYQSPPQDVLEEGRLRDYLSWLPHIPKPWRRFVRKCLDPASGKRFQSAGDLFSALGGLPTTPAWKCQLTGTAQGPAAQWTLVRDGIRSTASFTPRSQTRAEWSFERIGRSGRRLLVRGSNGKIVARSRALAALEVLLAA